MTCDPRDVMLDQLILALEDVWSVLHALIGGRPDLTVEEWTAVNAKIDDARLLMEAAARWQS